MLTPILEAKHLALSLLERHQVAIEGSCLHHAVAVSQVLGAPIVAGSLSWKFTRFDDGTNPNYFSYIFDPIEALQTLQSGRMPEMHCWNIYQGKVLDLTTCYLPQQAKKLVGFEWEPGLVPPEYYFGLPEKKNQHVYAGHDFATFLAQGFAEEILCGK